MEPARPTKGRPVRVRANAPVKTTLSLPEDTVEAVRALAATRNITQGEVIRRAVALDQYLHEAAREGGRVLVEDPDKTLRQLVFF
jgi:hypothetical protein